MNHELYTEALKLQNNLDILDILNVGTEDSGPGDKNIAEYIKQAKKNASIVDNNTREQLELYKKINNCLSIIAVFVNEKLPEKLKSKSNIEIYNNVTAQNVRQIIAKEEKHETPDFLANMIRCSEVIGNTASEYMANNKKNAKNITPLIQAAYSIANNLTNQFSEKEKLLQYFDDHILRSNQFESVFKPENRYSKEFIKHQRANYNWIKNQESWVQKRTSSTSINKDHALYL